MAAIHARERLRIALFMDLSLGYSASVARGIARHVHFRHDCVFRWLRPESKSIAEIRAWRAHAVIACFTDPNLARRVARLKLPIVNVGRTQRGLGLIQISNNDRAIGETAAQHFLQRGLRALAYVNGSGDPGDLDRERGLCRAARIAGASFHGFRLAPSNRVAPGRRVPRKLATWLSKLPKPVGLLAYNDGMAVRVIEACHEAGLAVPDAVAVLGVDNSDALALMCDPPLSSVMVAAEAIGYRAARAVLAAAVGGRREAGAFLPPIGVVTRQSTDVFATSDPVVVRALRFIAQHARERPSVVEVARASGVNRRTLERRFQEALKRSPLDELRRVQVLQAQELLTHSEMPLARVAEHCGFSSGKHFSVAFGRACGVPPSTYRKRKRTRSD